MTYKSQKNVTNECNECGVGWQLHQNRFNEMTTAIWPHATLHELSRKASLRELEEVINSGSLPPKHESLLKNYLNSLPGYGNPSLEQETERHHGYVTAFLHKAAKTDGSRSLNSLMSEAK
ncbi:hypothetical protein GCM10009425_39960 [Pseudomonas asuensis]|uniref:Uncharacterized protein n=2 Tax=Pseudomonas asuensis TaxID=1825787 RepID=A0ABQ2H137_9PSED|nr:hypothetical protein GCM10009425_39960 [Pseudomonas asuensis]